MLVCVVCLWSQLLSLLFVWGGVCVCVCVCVVCLSVMLCCLCVCHLFPPLPLCCIRPSLPYPACSLCIGALLLHTHMCRVYTFPYVCNCSTVLVWFLVFCQRFVAVVVCIAYVSGLVVICEVFLL